MAVAVLIIEQNNAFQRILTDVLTRHYATELTVIGGVCNVEEALAHYATITPALILLGMDATPDVTAHMTCLHHQWPEVPIVVMSLHDGEAYRARALAAGAAAFVSKAELQSKLLHVILGLLPDESAP